MKRDAGKISKVRVFIDRAAITRVQTHEVEGPLSKVCFAPVPLDVETSTLRAVARMRTDEGEVAIPVTGVTHRLLFNESPDGRRAEIQDELSEMDVKLNSLEDADSTESHAAQLLQRYAEIATRKLSLEWLDPKPPFDKLSEVFDHLRRTGAKLATSRVSRSEERTKLQTQRAKLLAEEHRLGLPSKLGLEVQVGLALPAGARGTMVVELTYITKEAQWMPAYNARHQDGQLRLTGVALVRQSTGEDWQDIQLIATTARPPLSEPAPELSQIEVHGYQGGEEKQIVSTHREGPRLQGAPAGVDIGDATVEHEAPDKVSVPQTRRPVRVELFESTLECQTRLEVAPMVRPVALLVAEAANLTGRVLLPGSVNMFRGPNYSGQAELGFVSPGQRFRLPLGTEGALRIKREVKAHPPKKATLSGATTHAFEQSTKLENTGAEALEVLVRDRVPVSRSEETSVKITEIDRAMEVDGETGQTSLQVSVAPHSKREVSTSFEITAPRGFSIQPPREL